MNSNSTVADVSPKQLNQPWVYWITTLTIAIVSSFLIVFFSNLKYMSSLIYSLLIKREKRRIKTSKNSLIADVNSCMNPAAKKESKIIPRSVNYHFTRQCNYSCGFCFHTAKTSFVLPMEEAQRGLTLLKEAGMEKVNFSGGEPFIHKRGQFVGELTKFCKETLKLDSVSIVSNGSLITEKWFIQYGAFLDILAVSCDSFEQQTNQLIGRQQGKKNHLESLKKVRSWCQKYKVAFKINTVVNTYNINEDMCEYIKELDPVRWKVFQCLLIGGENCGDDAIRNAERFVISDEDFHTFLDRHSQIKCLIPESNTKMKDSYLILDEYMRFLDCTTGEKKPSASVLDVGVASAIDASGFDEKMFLKRGGKYTWSKADMKLDW